MISESSSQKLINKRQWKTLSLLIALLVLTLLLTGCGSLEESVAKAKPLIPEGYEVIHIEQVTDNSGIVFYTYNDQISTGVFVKNTLGWDWIGSGIGKLVTYPEGLQWRYADLQDKSKAHYYVYYGKIINEDIAKVTVATTNGKVAEGKIVDTAKIKLWYAFVEEAEVPSVNADISGYSKDGKLLYLFSQPKGT